MMAPFTRLDAVAVPLDRANVDTDQIIPARYLRKPRGQGYGGFLLHDLRFDEHGRPDPGFPLNRPEWRTAGILVAGDNFGCGSSREAAVYALVDSGIRCVIAPGFADIFANNAVQNGLLCVTLPATQVAALRAELEAAPGGRLAVDLPAQTVTAADGRAFPFEIEAHRKRCLVEGLDQIGMTLASLDRIVAFETALEEGMPWRRATLPPAS